MVEACNLEGRQEQLENMLNLLELCEKALQDYLETKRIAFPRFYFVAPADLLDILSKGTNPQLILKHLAKCFDNVHNLEFTKGDNGAPTKHAIGMYSGEKEYVAFDAPCHCDGPVEVWLQNVVDSMRQSLRVEFRAAIVSYDEKPRTKWLFDQSAQNTIMVSRVFYTQEMNEAFEQARAHRARVFAAPAIFVCFARARHRSDAQRFPRAPNRRWRRGTSRP